jgi:uncharacterized protein YegJ (DUF2314 family)
MLVLLLAQPIQLKTATLASRLSSEFGRPFATSERGGDFIAGRAPLFLAAVQGRRFGIQCRAGKYPEFAPPPGLPDLRREKLMAQHTAWLQVEALSPGKPEDVDDAVGRVMAALYEGRVVGALRFPENEFATIPTNLRDWLSAEGGVAELFDQDEPRVVSVDGDDPRLFAARQEARRRLGEFAAAFAKGQGKEFMVKVQLPDKDGGYENIWMDVETITKDKIRGTLGNEPFELPGLHLGSSVEVARDSIVDWMYTVGEETKGGFTVKIFEEMEHENGRPAQR